jgi:soluble lytic murein transglycosylase-like protein
VSEAGAVGLLQILPSTARDPGFGVARLEGSDEEILAQLKDPDVNRRLGSEYLSAMLHRYHGDADLALVAYNAGPARADTAAKDERPLDKLLGVTERRVHQMMAGGQLDYQGRRPRRISRESFNLYLENRWPQLINFMGG